MIRLFVPQDLAPGYGIILTLEQSRYLTSVMRQAIGVQVLLFNGRDGEWRATLTETGKRGSLLKVDDQARPMALGPDLDLVVAMVKRGRIETIVEKAAELGVRRVRLAVTRRTNVDFVKLGRLDAIATEAAEQTGRMDVPSVEDPEKLDKILDGWDQARKLIFCDEAGDALPAIQALTGSQGPAAILIGPEGGFAPEERQRLRSLGFVIPVSLGPRILRADTAAISALTLWQAAAGDWRER